MANESVGMRRLLEADNTSDDNMTDTGENPLEFNIVFPLGMMLLALAAMSIPFNLARQSNIIACIIIGAVVGAMEWDVSMQLSRAAAEALSELGIIFVLFTAGMEVDIAGFLKMWRPALINGLGQIAITLGIFAGIGVGSGTTPTPVSAVYFGIACTCSSTILVVSALSSRGELQELHGQIILGLMALQDVHAVLAISIMPGFDSSIENPPPIGVVIGKIIGELAAMLFVLFLLSRFVLKHLFRIYAKSSDMLFIGTFSYCLGVSGVCSLFGLGEMGAFWAGVSIASLPYRHEIELHATPIKLFGVVVFFFMLGIDLHLTIEGLRAAIPMAAIVTALTIFVLPILMWMLGACSRMDSRSVFLVGHLINQVSEFSLIISRLARDHGIFDDKIFMIITLSTLLTFMLSSTGHSFADEIFRAVRCVLLPLDSRATLRMEREEGLLRDHVVVLGFSHVGLEVCEFYRRKGVEVLCLQDEPALHEVFLQFGAHSADPSAHQREPSAHSPAQPTATGSSDNGTTPTPQAKVPGDPACQSCAVEPVALATAENATGVSALEDAHWVGSRWDTLPNAAATTAAASEGAQSNIGVAVEVTASPLCSAPVPVAGQDGGVFAVKGDKSARLGEESRAAERRMGEGVGAIVANSLAADSPGMAAGGSGAAVDDQGAAAEAEAATAARRAAAERFPKTLSNVHAHYSNPMSPHAWHHFGLHEARLVVCCVSSSVDRAVDLAHELFHHDVPLVAVAESAKHALRLYRAKARFVIQEGYLAAHAVAEMLAHEGLPKPRPKPTAASDAAAGGEQGGGGGGGGGGGRVDGNDGGSGEEVYLWREKKALEKRLKRVKEDEILHRLAPFL